MSPSTQPANQSEQVDARGLASSAIEHELKLVAPTVAAGPLVQWLRARCLADPTHPDGLVNSIYFDSNALELLAAKVNSDFIKRKVRLRWYRDPASGAVAETAFAEIKQKIGARRFKARVPLPGVGSLLASIPPRDALAEMIGELRRAGHWLPTGLQPLVLIGFRRRRFLDPTSGARVSIDSRIEATSVNPALLPAVSGVTLAHAVIEVKGGDRRLSRWLEPLGSIGCRPGSFSKYERGILKLCGRASW